VIESVRLTSMAWSARKNADVPTVGRVTTLLENVVVHLDGLDHCKFKQKQFIRKLYSYGSERRCIKESLQ